VFNIFVALLLLLLLLLLLNVIGFKPGGRGTVRIYTQTVTEHTGRNTYKEKGTHIKMTEHI
jgi:hypothetical protein